MAWLRTAALCLGRSSHRRRERLIQKPVNFSHHLGLDACQQQTELDRDHNLARWNRQHAADTGAGKTQVILLPGVLHTEFALHGLRDGFRQLAGFGLGFLVGAANFKTGHG